MVSSRPVVSTTATLIAVNDTQARSSVIVKNVTGSESVYLGRGPSHPGGDAGVTTSTGWEWETTDGPISVDLGPTESLYGVITTSDQTLHVLQGEV